MYKVLCMKLGTSHKTRSYLHYQTKIIIWEWEREREREIEKKGTGEIPYTNLCCVFLLCFMLLLLSVPLFFVLSMSFLCVYLLSFSVSAFFFSSLRPLLFLSFFFYLCVPLFICREIPKETVPCSSLNWSDHGAVFFSFFPPQLLISCSAVTHFSAFFSFICSVAF